MAGVFITRGMGIRIPAGGLVISAGPDGKLDSRVQLQVSVDMCPYWLEIAVGHLDKAARARADVVEARATDQGKSIGTALEREFAAGMQALTSGAVALDALYASVRDLLSGISTIAVERRPVPRRTGDHNGTRLFLRSIS